ncbi:tetratricopeptide repeat protein [Coleofasciculus sp.]|uniref:tetratricopeptide repeat protein n=1 Tax=Coleofasciculus sp. TaxID=3100458 RepID=UPI003A2EB071
MIKFQRFTASIPRIPPKSRFRLSFMGLSLILATVSFLGRQSILPPAIATSERIANGQIIQLLGNVQVKRAYGTLIRPTTGIPIYPGDQLLTANGAQVFVQCTDLTVWSIPGGKNQVNTCATTEDNQDAKCSPGLVSCPDRGDAIAWNNPAIPYLISPRRTTLLNNKPTFRWHPVANATRYKVRVRGEDVDWQTHVNDTEITYSGETPLTPGVYYLWTVETRDRGSVEENIPELGFRILDSQTQAQIKTAASQILANDQLNPEAKALSLVNLYLSHDLKQNAIETLNDLVSQGNPTAAIYHQLGKLYRQVGLSQLAVQNYQKALEFAANKDTDITALVAEDLGEFYSALGETDKAREWYNQALAYYEALGDVQWVNER